MLDKKTKPIPVRFLVSDYDFFNKAYPRTFSKFLKKCVSLANKNKSFFEYVFFQDKINMDLLRFELSQDTNTFDINSFLETVNAGGNINVVN